MRNFPILGHIRYIFEFIRPEIQQYFIASDDQERPFNREQLSLVYERAKNIEAVKSFGVDYDIHRIGYAWVLHSLNPKHFRDINPRVMIGNEQCTQPYAASYLNISTKSFGALSQNAIEALNMGAKKVYSFITLEKGVSNYHLKGGDITLQIGTDYFVFRTKNGQFDINKFKEKALLSTINMIEIKLSKGAKPGHGGLLPKDKITPDITKIRDIAMTKDVVSPPVHSAFQRQ